MSEPKGGGSSIFQFAEDLRDVLAMAPGAIQDVKEKVAAAFGSATNPVVTATLLQKVDMGTELLQIWHVKTVPEVVLGIATKNVRLCACFVLPMRTVEQCQQEVLRTLLEQKDVPSVQP